MQHHRFLAAMVALLNPTATAEQIEAAVTAAVDRADHAYPPRDRQGTVSLSVVEERILAMLASCPHHPSMRELLSKVPGNRAKVHGVAKRMIDNGILEILRHGRSVGIKVK